MTYVHVQLPESCDQLISYAAGHVISCAHWSCENNKNNLFIIKIHQEIKIKKGIINNINYGLDRIKAQGFKNEKCSYVFAKVVMLHIETSDQIFPCLPVSVPLG